MKVRPVVLYGHNLSALDVARYQCCRPVILLNGFCSKRAYVQCRSSRAVVVRLEGEPLSCDVCRRCIGLRCERVGACRARRIIVERLVVEDVLLIYLPDEIGQSPSCRVNVFAGVRDVRG